MSKTYFRKLDDGFGIHWDKCDDIIEYFKSLTKIKRRYVEQLSLNNFSIIKLINKYGKT